MRQYHVYIMASLSRRLYIGVTSDLCWRVREHKRATIPGFSQRYRINRLVYFEQTRDIRVAITREKQLKRWPRHRKDRLVAMDNAGWLDLSADWVVDGEGEPTDTTSRAHCQAQACGRSPAC
ncbi:MAG: GIY-YIG nuclease family protein [Gemmatimonadaceae bacterium]